MSPTGDRNSRPIPNIAVTMVRSRRESWADRRLRYQTVPAGAGSREKPHYAFNDAHDRVIEGSFGAYTVKDDPWPGGEPKSGGGNRFGSRPPPDSG